MLPVAGSQLAKRLAGFVDMNRRGHFRLAKPGTVDQRRDCALAKRLAGIVVPVKPVALDRYKQVTRLGQTRVRADTTHARRAFPGNQLPLAACGDKFERAWFHHLRASSALGSSNDFTGTDVLMPK